MSQFAFKDQIEEFHFCRRCAEEVFDKWRGWPIKNKIPVPPVIVGGACPKCGGTDEILSPDIAWLNYHSEYSTGLPDYWLLTILTATDPARDFLFLRLPADQAVEFATHHPRRINPIE